MIEETNKSLLSLVCACAVTPLKVSYECCCSGPHLVLASLGARLGALVQRPQYGGQRDKCQVNHKTYGHVSFNHSGFCVSLKS